MEELMDLNKKYSEVLEKTADCNKELHDIMESIKQAKEELRKKLNEGVGALDYLVCTICHERKKARALSCGHCYCNTCCGRIMQGASARCPVCRAPIIRSIRVYIES